MGLSVNYLLYSIILTISLCDRPFLYNITQKVKNPDQIKLFSHKFASTYSDDHTVGIKLVNHILIPRFILYSLYLAKCPLGEVLLLNQLYGLIKSIIWTLCSLVQLGLHTSRILEAICLFLIFLSLPLCQCWESYIPCHLLENLSSEFP